MSTFACAGRFSTWCRTLAGQVAGQTASLQDDLNVLGHTHTHTHTHTRSHTYMNTPTHEHTHTHTPTHEHTHTHTHTWTHTHRLNWFAGQMQFLHTTFRWNPPFYTLSSLQSWPDLAVVSSTSFWLLLRLHLRTGPCWLHCTFILWIICKQQCLISIWHCCFLSVLHSHTK